MRSNPTTRAQRGSSLVEALVTFLVLSLGMIAIAWLQGHLRMVADVPRQRSEAVRLAQQGMETLRGFATLVAAGTTRSFDVIESTSRVVDAGTAYRIDRQINATTLPHAKAASITVGWTDRSGSARQVALHSIIAGSDPAPSAALALGPAVASSPR